MGVRTSGPGGKPVADAKGVGDGLAVLGARHAVASRVVGIGDAAVGHEAVEVVVGVCAVERIGANFKTPRCNAPDGVVLVGEAAERRAACGLPRYVRHAVHDVVGVLYHKSIAVRDRREPPVPSAVAEAKRGGSRGRAHFPSILMEPAAARRNGSGRAWSAAIRASADLAAATRRSPQSCAAMTRAAGEADESATQEAS